MLTNYNCLIPDDQTTVNTFNLQLQPYPTQPQERHPAKAEHDIGSLESSFVLLAEEITMALVWLRAGRHQMGDVGADNVAIIVKGCTRPRTWGHPSNCGPG